ncbi:GDSL-type esterase/lipase family protein [Niabella sp. CC-SYL272]|uniref:GDSL-type esterase/lipase family protein n=1 Tax=Niabella agricola TaxID=2891571 RepID=UPI001F2EB1F8|nr:GDSL-type esterase/lipase family protein [Niabella agricola]MCF3109376.1 GDSL-type esterase/lipase family protein [Niabella agricola]
MVIPVKIKPGHPFIANRLLLTLLLLTLFRTSDAKERPVRVACIGNSVTFGWGLNAPETTAYPSQLQQLLGATYIVKNFGHSGATVLSKGHNPYFRTRAFSNMMDFGPDIAVIHLGLNDTDPRDFPGYRDEFTPDYNRLIDTIKKKNPGVKIYICSLTPIFTGHSRFLSSTFTWYWELQEQIQNIAISNNLRIIDLHKVLHNRPDLFTDAATLHPNESGAAMIAKTVYQHLTGNFGGLQLPPLFTQNMILQRDEPIRIWGLANAGTPVSIKFMHMRRCVAAGYDGKWQVFFPASKGMHTPQEMEIHNEQKTIRLQNILIGDVWLCAGQSNMYFPLSQSTGGDRISAQANPARPLRLFNYTTLAETDNRVWTPEELKRANNLDFFSGSWATNTKAAASGFSAIGYTFGTEIMSKEQVPVGLIEVAVGGSPLISWVSRHALESNPLFAPAFKNWRQSDYLMQWCRARVDVNLKNATSVFQRHPYEPAYNFEAAIAKLLPFPIKGIIWYQGESDAENAELYQKLFPVFVTDWRKKWNKHLPFYYVQLSGINRPSWNHFRDTQRKLLADLGNSGMVVTSDLGDPEDVHYRNKIPVGLRLARLALNKTYHKNVTASGPMVRLIKTNGTEVQVCFDYAAGLKTADGKPLRGFQLVTAKGLFIPVTALIKNNAVTIRLPKATPVKKIAYGWEPYTNANLVNKDGLPASTFIKPLK